MRVVVVADLHLDLWLAAGRDPIADIAAHHPDVLIVAGDLSNKPKVRWPRMLAHIAQHIDLACVYVMPGNHDYYDHCLDDEDRLTGICEAAGAQFVQKRELHFGAARFLCCTLWTDFALYGDPTMAMTRAAAGMNDYQYIRMARRGYGRIRPADTAQVHADHRAWLDARLGEPHDGPTIVVTHHCPLPALVGERQGTMAPAYASDLSELIEQHQPDFWFFGHTHAAAETCVGKTIARNVSLGYPDEEDCEPRLALDGVVICC